MCDPVPPGDPINQYAVVCYIPEKLGDFITSLRRELVSGCTAQSHVTILPPRPLTADAGEAERDLRIRSVDFCAFRMDIPRIRIFRETSVIFADIGAGREQFFEMHDALNSGVFAFDEPFSYHPHITLAQGIDPADLEEMYDLAVRRWQEAPHYTVHIENLTFVQNTSNNRWIDLAECELRNELAVPAGVGVRRR